MLILKTLFPVLAFLLVWEMVWKGIAMYKAGQKGEIGRFICIFIFNTFGLLPIIYLLTDDLKKDIDLSNERNNINKETKQTKKITKGGMKKGENAMQGKKQKELPKDTGKRKTANTKRK